MDAFATRRVFQSLQCLRQLIAIEALHCGKCRHNSKPARLDGKGEQSQTGDSNEANNDGSHQTARPTHEIPQERAEDFSSIQGINRKNVEEKKSDVDHIQGSGKPHEVRIQRS